MNLLQPRVALLYLRQRSKALAREMAISIHVYGADLERLGSSIHRRYDDLEIVPRERHA